MNINRVPGTIITALLFVLSGVAIAQEPSTLPEYYGLYAVQGDE